MPTADPGRVSELLEEIGITVPRLPVRTIMSAVAEDAVGESTLDEWAKSFQAWCLESGESTDVLTESGGSSWGQDTESDTDDETKGIRASLTCAAASRRSVPRLPLQAYGEEAVKHREKIHAEC